MNMETKKKICPKCGQEDGSGQNNLHDMNLMKDCSLEKTDEDMYYNSEWDYTCEESELEPEDKNDPDVHKVYEAGMFEIKKRTITKPNGDLITVSTPLVTGKGQVYLVNKFLKEYISK